MLNVVPWVWEAQGVEDFSLEIVGIAGYIEGLAVGKFHPGKNAHTKAFEKAGKL